MPEWGKAGLVLGGQVLEMMTIGVRKRKWDLVGYLDINSLVMMVLVVVMRGMMPLAFRFGACEQYHAFNSSHCTPAHSSR